MDELFEKIQKLIADKLEMMKEKLLWILLSEMILELIALILMNWYMLSKKNWELASQMKKQTNSKLFAMLMTSSSLNRANNSYN